MCTIWTAVIVYSWFVSQDLSACPPWYDQACLQHNQNEGIVLVCQPCASSCCELSSLALGHILYPQCGRWSPLCVRDEHCGCCTWRKRSRTESCCAHPLAGAGTKAIKCLITSFSSGPLCALWSSAETGSLGWPQDSNPCSHRVFQCFGRVCLPLWVTVNT